VPVLMLAPEDIQVLLEGWIRIRTEQGKFFPSEWNAQQLTRLIHHQVETNGWVWGLSAFDDGNDWLQANGYMETERHHRGQAAPKEYPVYEAPKPQNEPTKTGNGSVFIRQDPNEEKAARAMDFDSLKKKAQSSFSTDRR
jgi:hypothetical protein